MNKVIAQNPDLVREVKNSREMWGYLASKKAMLGDALYEELTPAVDSIINHCISDPNRELASLWNLMRSELEEMFRVFVFVGVDTKGQLFTLICENPGRALQLVRAMPPFLLKDIVPHPSTSLNKQ